MTCLQLQNYCLYKLINNFIKIVLPVKGDQIYLSSSLPLAVQVLIIKHVTCWRSLSSSYLTTPREFILTIWSVDQVVWRNTRHGVKTHKTIDIKNRGFNGTILLLSPVVSLSHFSQ